VCVNECESERSVCAPFPLLASLPACLPAGVMGVFVLTSRQKERMDVCVCLVPFVCVCVCLDACLPARWSSVSIEWICISVCVCVCQSRQPHLYIMLPRSASVHSLSLPLGRLWLWWWLWLEWVRGAAHSACVFAMQGGMGNPPPCRCVETLTWTEGRQTDRQTAVSAGASFSPHKGGPLLTHPQPTPTRRRRDGWMDGWVGGWTSLAAV